MNYRHAYHAGNFADVLKHAALIAILLHLRKKETGFAVVDTHAGSGRYDLSGTEAGKTGEAEGGIRRLHQGLVLPLPLEAYRQTVEGFAPFYPGSPLIAAQFLRPQDRLIAVEKHDEEYAALKEALAGRANTEAIKGDGYEALLRLLPPRERRGLVLVDPPFEEENEFAAVASALAHAYRRFATGIYLFWYPVKTRGAVEAVSGELLNAGVTKLLRLTLDVGEGAPPGPGRGPRLSATGLLVVNAPYGFAAAMEDVLPALVDRLKAGPGASYRVERLAES